MKYGFVLPKGDAGAAAQLAHEAEAAGWDGFFVWDSVWGIDSWVTLPLVKPLCSGSARKATARAISSGLAKRAIGTRPSISASV
jgi:hypothetical protein